MERVPALVGGAFLAVFAGLFVYASIAPQPGKLASPLDPARHLAGEEEKIRDRMIDPESTKFRKDFVSVLSGAPVVCGEINYKNSLGGYVGYQQFIWVSPDAKYFGAETKADEMKRQWETLCEAPKTPTDGALSGASR